MRAFWPQVSRFVPGRNSFFEPPPRLPGGGSPPDPMKKASPYFFLVLAILLPIFSQAHGLGQTISKEVGEYLIDVDYDAFIIQAGEVVRFDFSLWDRERTEFKDVTSIWLRISPENSFGSVFASSLSVPEFGLPGITYVFPRAGNYELSLRFHYKDDTLAEATLPIAVQKSPNESEGGLSRSQILAGVVGIILGFLLATILRKKK